MSVAARTDNRSRLQVCQIEQDARRQAIQITPPVWLMGDDTGQLQGLFSECDGIAQRKFQRI